MTVNGTANTQRTAILSTACLTVALIGCEAPTLTSTVTSAAVCASAPDLVFVNGRFLTVDGDDSVASVVRVRGSRITSVGDDAGPVDACTQTIDLGGRMVIPGLINDHVHFLRGGMRPGHEVHAVQTAYSIAELQEAIRQRATTVPTAAGIPTGKDFITIIATWNASQFVEDRFPTLEELDEAAPDHPVYMMQGRVGPGSSTAGAGRFSSRKASPCEKMVWSPPSRESLRPTRSAHTWL